VLIELRLPVTRSLSGTQSRAQEQNDPGECDGSQYPHDKCIL
jgi:hypothetical protein